MSARYCRDSGVVDGTGTTVEGNGADVMTGESGGWTPPSGRFSFTEGLTRRAARCAKSNRRWYGWSRGCRQIPSQSSRLSASASASRAQLSPLRPSAPLSRPPSFLVCAPLPLSFLPRYTLLVLAGGRSFLLASGACRLLHLCFLVHVGIWLESHTNPHPAMAPARLRR